jgi:hypothetical protein
MSRQPDTVLEILQLLLRCGMICQEELTMVLDVTAAPVTSNSDDSLRMNPAPHQGGEDSSEA